MKIRKAVFGKFKRGVTGIPVGSPVYDVTEEIKAKVASGISEIPVNEDLLDVKLSSNKNKALRVVYSSNGEEKTATVEEGGTISFAQPMPEPVLIANKGNTYWQTPYAGELTYSTSTGEKKKLQVKSVPEPLELNGSWELEFPSEKGNNRKATFERLTSWSGSSDDAIRYFSGTASYKKQFQVPANLLGDDYSLELNLGDVKVIAEVILNGKNLGVCWKAPYRINIDSAVKAGNNKLEIRITNLWANSLIGDENLPPDYERKGANVKQWPDWLLNKTERPSARTTFAACKHWGKDSELLPSGLLGPVKITIYKKIEISQ